MQEINALLLKLLRHIYHVIQCETALTVLISGYADIDYKIIPALLSDLPYNLQGKPESSVNVTTILIRSLIIKRCQKSAQQTMRMCTLDFHSVSASFLKPERRLAELPYQHMQLLNRDSPRCRLRIIRSHIRRSYKLWCPRNRKRHIRRVEKLREYLRVILMHSVHKLLPAGDIRVIVYRHIPRKIGVGRLNSRNLCHDKPDTSPCPVGVVLYKRVRHIALIRQISGQRGHKNSVLHSRFTYLNGFKQVWKIVHTYPSVHARFSPKNDRYIITFL